MRRLVTTVSVLVAVGCFGACVLGCPKPRRDAIIGDDAPAPADDAIVVTLTDAADAVTLDGRPFSSDTLVAAFRTARAGTVRIEAPPKTEWGRVIGVLDQMLQAGGFGRAFVFGISGDRARRSSEIRLPKATNEMLPPGLDAGAAPNVTTKSMTVVAITKDGKLMLNGAALAGDLGSALAKVSPPIREQWVVIEGDMQASYSYVVDATLVAQRQDARVMFSVTMQTPAPPR